MNEGPHGTQAFGYSQARGVDATGMHILFHSEASRLVPFDTNAAYDVFLAIQREGTPLDK